MEKLMSIWNAVMSPEAMVYWMAALGVSEALALIPAVKSNSIFQLVYNGLSWIKGKLLPSK